MKSRRHYPYRHRTHRDETRELRKLYRAASLLFHTTTLADLGRLIADSVTTIFHYTDCRALIPDEHGEFLLLLPGGRTGFLGLQPGDPDAEIRATTMRIDGSGLIPLALRTGEMVYAPDARAHPDYVEGKSSTRSELVVPLRVADRVIGVLDLQSDLPDAFSARDHRLLRAYAENAAAALEIARLLEAVSRHASALEERVTERTAELHAALAQARELDTMKANFISMVSHEFRTPLAVIHLSVQILERLRGRQDSALYATRLHTISAQVRHLTQLANGVMLLGRAERVGMVYTAHPIDPAAYLTNQIDLLRMLAGTHTIFFTPSGCPGIVQGDEMLLGHIVHNLVSNAIKYSPKGGTIEVDLDCTEDRLCLTVTDHGIGIPAEQQSRLYDLFYRADNVGMIAGSGLGMAIVRMAVTAYNGSITFESQEGIGTTFTVQLPYTR